ncbi:hypothetical protein UFOVP75_83 [uncultured Caudovirales phage]|uniref:Uncharacterized protein n=1 Tax=uncultured Caudovirales phage TaxID=2100421 RepID=A0A6J5L0X2_9CAUD|nr:hypothetical protein UFOVP75_83 [uncultured Caudovirales phage]
MSHLKAEVLKSDFITLTSPKPEDRIPIRCKNCGELLNFNANEVDAGLSTYGCGNERWSGYYKTCNTKVTVAQLSRIQPSSLNSMFYVQVDTPTGEMHKLDINYYGANGAYTFLRPATNEERIQSGYDNLKALRKRLA